MIYLKQSTASQEVLLGPFVDATDGNTAETGLTIANTDIKIHKAGATTLANKNSGGATHISGGNYYAVFDATDTDTLGSGCIIVQVSGALAVRVDFVVLAANVYDALIGGGDLLDVNTAQFGNTNGTFASGVPAVNAVQISGDATAADNLETAFDDTAGPVPWQGIIDQGTAQSATSTTLVLRSAAAFANSELIGATVVITGGSAGVGQAREITAYNGATDTATVDTWTTTPTGTITYKIMAGPPAPATAPAVNLTHIGGAAVSTSSAQLGVNVVSMAANSMTAAAAASDLTTELQSGLATSAALSTVAGYLDTEVASIKAVTDKLDTAMELDSAVYRFTANALEQAPSGTGASAASIRAEMDANSTQFAAIRSKTDNLPAAPAATGDIPTAAAIADAVHDEVVDGTTTFRQSTRLANSVLGGKLSGAGTGTEVVRDLADSKNRATFTVDDDGNRTAVTRDLT